MSSSVGWHEDFRTGNDVLDAQHKKLFELLNLLQACVEKRSGIIELQHIIMQLERYVVVHFNLEESILKEVGFPEFDAHCREHASFVAKLHEFAEPVRSGQKWPAASLLRYLIDWVGNHIRIQDQKYVPFLQGKRPAV